MQDWSLKQSLLWAQVSQLILIYLLGLVITPYCPWLALVYWFVLLLCMVYGHALSLSFELFNFGT